MEGGQKTPLTNLLVYALQRLLIIVLVSNKVTHSDDFLQSLRRLLNFTRKK